MLDEKCSLFDGRYVNAESAGSGNEPRFKECDEFWNAGENRFCFDFFEFRGAGKCLGIGVKFDFFRTGDTSHFCVNLFFCEMFGCWGQVLAFFRTGEKSHFFAKCLGIGVKFWFPFEQE